MDIQSGFMTSLKFADGREAGGVGGVKDEIFMFLHSFRSLMLWVNCIDAPPSPHSIPSS